VSKGPELAFGPLVLSLRTSVAIPKDSAAKLLLLGLLGLLGFPLVPIVSLAHTWTPLKKQMWHHRATMPLVLPDESSSALHHTVFHPRVKQLFSFARDFFHDMPRALSRSTALHLHISIGSPSTSPSPRTTRTTPCVIIAPAFQEAAA